jgi:predicted nucleic acid-binding protein
MVADRSRSPTVLIAGTAVEHGLTVGTRDTADLGVAVTDPWREGLDARQP